MMDKRLSVLILCFLAACVPAKQWQPSPSAIALPGKQFQMIGKPPAGEAAASPVIPTSLPAGVTESAESLPTLQPAPPTPELDLAAESAVLIDAGTGDILYDRNARERMFPASTTKIMTALLALEVFKPEEMIWVGEEVNLAWTSARLDSQKAGLFYRQELSMRDLLHGLLLPSGSDAAFVIAVNVARRESGDDFLPIDQAVERFIGLMNARASEIGAKGTNFVNPDGYHDPHHYSTAYDLGLIAWQAMQNPVFREIVAAPVYKPAETRSEDFIFDKTWQNTNRLINPQDPNYYPAANGIKTGTTGQAGYCLVSSAVFEENMVIAVVLNSTQENVWTDSVTLLEYANGGLE